MEGLNVTNPAIRAAFDGLGEMMGENARKMIFRNAGLERFIDNPPDYSFDRSFTNREQTLIYHEAISLVGGVGVQGILRQMDYIVAEIIVTRYNALDSIKDCPPEEKIGWCIEYAQSIVHEGTVVVDGRGMPALDVFDCRTCEGIRSERPYCSHYAGGLQFVTDWTFGKGKYVVVEEKCKAMGHDTWLFVIGERG